MAQLLLAKHSMPQIAPEVVSHRWVLSEAGRIRAQWLAQAWRDRGVDALYASLEPKALETAALVGAELGLAVTPWRGLEENDRTGLGYLPPDELQRTIARFFDAPGERVIGRETAAGALARFEHALREIVGRAADRPLGVVAHGTVISLLVAAHNPVDPMELWGRLETPSYLAVDAAGFSWDGVVHRASAA